MNRRVDVPMLLFSLAMLGVAGCLAAYLVWEAVR